SISLWGGGWKVNAAAALLLVALIGGATAVVTLESLSAPAPDNSMAAADRTIAGAAFDSMGKAKPTRKLTSARPAPGADVEIVHADDAGNGLTPSEGSPLPKSAKV